MIRRDERRRSVAAGIAAAWIVAAVFATTVGAPRPGHTQAASDLAVVARLVGQYRNAATDGGRGAIESATDAALDEARPLVRALARPRILRNNPPFERVAIALEGNDVEVAFDDDRSYRAPLGGASIARRSPGGSAMDVSYRIEGDALVSIAVARQGSSRTTYVLDDDVLLVTTVIESDRLPAPVRFTMRFQRSR